VFDLIAELKAYGVEVFVHDPVADAGEVLREYGVALLQRVDLTAADAVVLAVAHTAFVEMDAQAFATLVHAGGCLVDVKSCLDAVALNSDGLEVWRL
jgi:UDP-N-acetyl-D-galactosamine dehydrogenase